MDKVKKDQTKRGNVYKKLLLQLEMFNEEKGSVQSDFRVQVLCQLHF